MFNKKRIKKFERWFDDIKEALDSIDTELEDIVFCKECGVAIKKDKAQKVKEVNFPTCIFSLATKGSCTTNNLYYCSKHKKPYDRVVDNFGTKYYKTNVEVNKKGKEIKKSNK